MCKQIDEDHWKQDAELKKKTAPEQKVHCFTVEELDGP